MRAQCLPTHQPARKKDFVANACRYRPNVQAAQLLQSKPHVLKYEANVVCSASSLYIFDDPRYPKDVSVGQSASFILEKVAILQLVQLWHLLNGENAFRLLLKIPAAPQVCQLVPCCYTYTVTRCSHLSTVVKQPPLPRLQDWSCTSGRYSLVRLYTSTSILTA